LTNNPDPVNETLALIYDGDPEMEIEPSTVGGLSKAEAKLHASVIESIRDDLMNAKGPRFVKAVLWSFTDDYSDVPEEGTLGWYAQTMGWQEMDLRRLLLRGMSPERRNEAREIVGRFCN
jgi:hypothetical protein